MRPQRVATCDHNAANLALSKGVAAALDRLDADDALNDQLQITRATHALLLQLLQLGKPPTFEQFAIRACRAGAFCWE
jgi:hypothetical protein